MGHLTSQNRIIYLNLIFTKGTCFKDDLKKWDRIRSSSWRCNNLYSLGFPEEIINVWLIGSVYPVLLKLYAGDRMDLALGVIESTKLFNGKADNYIAGAQFSNIKQLKNTVF